MTDTNPPLRIGFFPTCLVDLFRPSVAFAAIQLLRQAGCIVEVPLQQSCCGQPAFNNGDEKTASTLAKQLVDTYSSYDYLVAPSGSCVAMIKHHYLQLLGNNGDHRVKTTEMAAKSHEIVSFLHDVVSFQPERQNYPGVVTYHDGCSGLRELSIKTQARNLLRAVHGMKLKEMEDNETCCGFGGTFCVKYPRISEKIVDEKIDRIHASGAQTLLSGEIGCLLNIAGRLNRLNSPVRCFHVVELLAGMTDKPALGEKPAD